jgi:dienelactone hydrolase
MPDVAGSRTDSVKGTRGVDPAVVVRAARGDTRAVVLVLYGGKADSSERSRPWHLSAVRMWPFARQISRRLARDGVAVWTLRYRVRGWNGAEASPVADARWALDEIRARHGHVPVVLVGHSMGGRTALRVADDPQVVGIVALAPWLPAGEPRVRLGVRRLLIVHGTVDRWTDPNASQAYVEVARAAGTPAHWIPMRGHGHFMLRERGTWRRLTTQFVAEVLGDVLAQAEGSSAPNSPHNG